MTPAGSYTETDFKETEIGLIPADWETASFDMSILSGKANVGKLNSSEFKTVGRYPIVDQGQQFIAGYTDEENLVFQGSLPVIVFGDHTRVFKYIDFPFVCGADGVKVLQPNASLFNPLFLFFALASLRIPNKGYNRHYKLLQEEKIPLPPLPEQRRIADALNAIQDDIAAQDDILSEARAFKRSLMERLFTYGPGEYPAATKETEIGEIPAHWEIFLTDDIKLDKKSIVSGPFGSNIGKRFFVDEGIPLIRGNNLTKGEQLYKDWGYVFITEEKALELKSCEAISDDLVFTAAGTIGQVGLIPRNGLYSKYIISNKQLRLRVDKDKAFPLFLFYWYSSSAIQNLIQSQQRGTSIPVINLSILRSLPVPVPDLSEQREIATQLSEIDAKIAVEEDRKAALQDVFQSALHQLMSGQVRLSNDEGLPI